MNFIISSVIVIISISFCFIFSSCVQGRNVVHRGKMESHPYVCSVRLSPKHTDVSIIVDEETSNMNVKCFMKNVGTNDVIYSKRKSNHVYGNETLNPGEDELVYTGKLKNLFISLSEQSRTRELQLSFFYEVATHHNQDIKVIAKWGSYDW